MVEALACGHESVGIDISSLAEFIARMKCTVFSEAELKVLQDWSRGVAGAVNIHRPSKTDTYYEGLGYYKHLGHASRWRLRKAIEQSIESAVSLGAPRLVTFGRCVVLRTAQWALDGRSKRASVRDFRQVLSLTAKEMIDGARELQASVKMSGRQPVTIIRRSAIGIDEDERLLAMRAPRLIVTSPPYPVFTFSIIAGK